jgi:hypothetical protein
MKLRILLAGLICGLVAFAAENGPELFQKAVTLEKANGNLEEAIKLYQHVAKEFSSDRALAAKALMQEAHCYELLGQDGPAIKIYGSRSTWAISVNPWRRLAPSWPHCSSR